MKKIAIIGAGFSGTMTAVQLIYKAASPIHLFLISEKETLNKGIAFGSYSSNHLLNVIAGKMSAFPDRPHDFVEWLVAENKLGKKDRVLISQSFISRKLYGNYIEYLWNEAKKLAVTKGIKISVIEDAVVDLELKMNQQIQLVIGSREALVFDYCVIATGNQAPRNPHVKNQDFHNSKNYFQNPWNKACVTDVSSKLPVLIIGNGLTMVDTVTGLRENGFDGVIYSVSPNGFNILPHRHGGLPYSGLVNELNDDMNLGDLVSIINRHIKNVRELGISAEPVIDSLRPYTQTIWRRLSSREKKVFMGRLRHLWGVARHRIPLHIHDKIQQERIEGKLNICSGKLIDLIEADNGVEATYFDKHKGAPQRIIVSRVINCTGPETDINYIKGSFLKNCLQKGILIQDPLKLGIAADVATYQIRKQDNTLHSNLFTLGSHLKGELWESTAVNELRVQAEQLASALNHIIFKKRTINSI